MARRKDSPQSALSQRISRMSRRSRKGSDGAKVPGRFAQMRQIYTTTKANDPSLNWWLLLAWLVPFGVLLIVGFIVHHPLYFGVLGIVFGILAAMIVLGRRAESAAYRSIEGQPGAAGAALSSLRRGWYAEREPVAAEASRRGNAKDVSSAAMVFRAIGRPGVVLVAEGPKGPALRLAESERKKVVRVTGQAVPVTIMRVGRGDDTVPINRLTKRVSKLKPVLTKAEAAAVNKRLKALGGVKPPVPAGVDPTKVRMDRKGLRGR
ncbi:MAG TPA: DUF4191 domain-containing protein [Segeticoccus sp.]|uniref:DUF4191 domain-containing protein n=1 Tax=Segeticoccus sp. TaxID=2706531 RepID=UPI002D7F9818|nr:DUF4191 domain-containing protein [Segeticoccus sp.]HET8601284.1 DUF4191 domain-containing protein [Segeticoccus sp.]